MKLIQGLTSQPRQESTLLLADGTPATFTLEYKPAQLGWFFDVQWSNFDLRGQRLTSSPNFLRQFRQRLNWGIALLGQNNVEPTGQSDLVDGTATLYLLDLADVLAVEAAFYPDAHFPWAPGYTPPTPPTGEELLDESGLPILDELGITITT